MESSLLLMRPYHIAAITHRRDTGGTSKTRRREVRQLSGILIISDAAIVPNIMVPCKFDTMTLAD